MTISVWTILAFYFGIGFGIAVIRELWQKILNKESLELEDIMSTIILWGFPVVFVPIFWVIDNTGIIGVLLVLAIIGFFVIL